MEKERKKKPVLVLGKHGRMGIGGGFGKLGHYKECAGSGRSVEGLVALPFGHRHEVRYKCPRCGSTFRAEPKYNVVLELKWLLDDLRSLQSEADAFSHRANKAAGTRLRKGCLDAQRRLKKIRDMVQDCKKDMGKGSGGVL